jgi:hypothetical protein
VVAEVIRFLAGLLIMVWGMFIGALIECDHNNTAAIAHHAAHYDPQTREFVWNQGEDGK